MKKSDCWREAHALIKRGELDPAMEFCMQAPCSESSDCQRFLGWQYYRRGEMEDAIQWFTRASEQGDRSALHGLGCVYFSEKKYPQAMQYYERAADESFPLGYYGVGYLYDQGLGVPQNTEKASQYFRKGAAYGHFWCKRGLIEHKLRNRSLLIRFLARLELIGQMLKASVIMLRNVNDPRLSGMPNAVERKWTR